MKWAFEERSRTVHELRFTGVKSGWEQWILCTADHHWDNPHCDLGLLKRHFDEAIQRKAPIIVAGDLFCAMQGKYDKRASKDTLRPEHQDGNYLDKLVGTAAKWYRPYAKNIILMGLGNHETAILERHETNILERLTEQLRLQGGITRLGGYSGWLRIMFERGCERSSKRLWYFHGAGGGGPVTKGLIDFNRYAESIDADFIVTGHTHSKTYHEIRRLSLNDASQIEQKTIHMLRCSAYKDEYADGRGGFHVERGRQPRPMGGWWIRFYYRNTKIHAQIQGTEE